MGSLELSGRDFNPKKGLDLSFMKGTGAGRYLTSLPGKERMGLVESES
jgi:hypothetical protein